jgi:hypothetical protein
MRKQSLMYFSPASQKKVTTCSMSSCSSSAIPKTSYSNQAVPTRPSFDGAPCRRHLRTDRGASPRARSSRTGGRLVERVVLVLVGSTTVTQGVEPPGVRAGRSALHALEQRVLRRRGRHDLEPLQFSTDTGGVTVCLVEHLQAYLDSMPIS